MARFVSEIRAMRLGPDELYKRAKLWVGGSPTTIDPTALPPLAYLAALGSAAPPKANPFLDDLLGGGCLGNSHRLVAA